MTESVYWQATPSGKVRARSLGLNFPGQPGKFNSITDVAGVAVGYTTIIDGNGALIKAKGPIRTGVTAILPRGNTMQPCFAGCSSFNGNGEMTGTLWIDEVGELQTPITITNTNSCGTARDATIKWMCQTKAAMSQDWGLPVAAETYDGDLNDINGFHVTTQHVLDALDNASCAPLELGSVGGGTGMICYEFKGGSSSASRIIDIDNQSFTLGVFVQSNFGLREELTILGVPVGQHLKSGKFKQQGTGSIIVIIATDVPLLPHQLKRLARRVPVGLSRTGTIGHHSSGDIFLAFSTANLGPLSQTNSGLRNIEYLPDHRLDCLFEAVAQSVEEAVIDSMIANESMTGCNDFTVQALPHQALLEIMERYNRLKY